MSPVRAGTTRHPADGGRLVNLTEHVVVLYLPDGTHHTLAPATGLPVPRVDAVARPVGTTSQGLPIVCETPAGAVRLPPPDPGVVWLVSRRVLDATPDRTDLAAPGELVRESGQVVGCRRLVVNPVDPTAPPV